MPKLKIIITSITIIVLTFFTVVFLKGVRTISVITSNSDSSLSAKLAEDDRWDILILGTQPVGGLKNGLSDSIMVFSYKKETNESALFSIPRDLWVNIPGYGMHKINEAYVYGEIKKPKGGGLVLAKEVVSNVTGLDIDFVVAGDIDALKKIVDELGGIDVSEDNYFSTGDFYGRQLKVHPGLNHLSGNQTLAYVGSRFDSDFGRMKRQQKALMAIKEKFLSLNLLTRPDKILSILDAVSTHLRTDFPLSQINEVVKMASALDIQNIKRVVFDNSNYLYHPPTDDRGYILLPKKGDFSEIHKVVQETLDQELDRQQTTDSEQPTAKN